MRAAPQRAARVEWIPPGMVSTWNVVELPSRHPARADRLVSWLALLLLAGCVAVATYDVWLLLAGLR